MPPDRRVVVTTNAATVRRSLAPSAWVVLEELAFAAGVDRMAVTSTRQLADSLSISKDNAARSLQRLMSAGLVERLDERDPSTGRFGAVAYLVDLAAAGLELEPERVAANSCGIAIEASASVSHRTTKPSSRPTRSRATRRVDASSNCDQLDLFGA